MQTILGSWVDSICREDGDDDDERIEPSVSEGDGLPPAEERLGLPPFGMRPVGVMAG